MNIKSKAEALELLKMIDYLQMYRITERIGIKWSALRLPKENFPNMPSLLRKIVRMYCRLKFPTSDIKLLTRGIRVDFPMAMRPTVKFLYARHFYGPDVERRRELIQLPEAAALANSAAALLNRSSSTIEIDQSGTYAVFRCYESDISNAMHNDRASSISGLLAIKMESVELFRTYLDEFSTIIQTSERRLELLRQQEEERIARENAETIKSANDVLAILSQLRNETVRNGITSSHQAVDRVAGSEQEG